jgi:hypothetical protein
MSTAPATPRPRDTSHLLANRDARSAINAIVDTELSRMQRRLAYIVAAADRTRPADRQSLVNECGAMASQSRTLRDKLNRLPAKVRGNSHFADILHAVASLDDRLTRTVTLLSR